MVKIIIESIQFYERIQNKFYILFAILYKTGNSREPAKETIVKEIPDPPLRTSEKIKRIHNKNITLSLN